MTTGSRSWAVIVIVGICILGALSISGNGKVDSAKRAAVAAEDNTRIAQENSDRTECIRGINAELDHAHWVLVGQAFNARSPAEARLIGRHFVNLPLITDLTAHGGLILKVHVDRCPPAPSKETP